MNVTIVGPGRIGSNVARRLALAGHALTLTYARDQQRVHDLADETGGTVAAPAAAVDGAEVVVISVPWGTLAEALWQLGSLQGKIVIDTTNQFGPGAKPEAGQTAAVFNAARMPGARYTKSFNTLTAAFQAQAAERPDDEKVVQWLCGDDQDAKLIVSGLITEAGYVPVDLGGTADSAVMEAPRRPGAVYGEEYRLPDARQVLAAIRAGQPIPPTPSYR